MEVIRVNDPGQDGEKQLPSKVEKHQLEAFEVPSSMEELMTAFYEQLQPETLEAYRRDLEMFREWADMPTVAYLAEVLAKEEDAAKANYVVLRWRSHLQSSGSASNTINRRLSAIRSLLKFLRTVGRISWTLEVPNVRVTKYKDTAGPGREGVDKILEILEGDEDSKMTRRNRAVACLLFYQALRRVEVYRLNCEDVELQKGRIWIHGKGRTEKEHMTLCEEAELPLVRWLEVRGGHNGPLFTSFDPAGKGDGRLSKSAIHRIVQRLGKRAGVKAWPHGLRHTAITTALDETGGDVRAVQRFSRHKKIETVITYDDNRDDLGGKVADKIGEAMKRTRKKKGKEENDT